MAWKIVKHLFLSLLAVFFVSACHVNNDIKEETKAQTASLNTIQLISRSLSKREINRNEAALYKTYAIFDREKLPEKYKSPVPQKDATLVIRQLKRDFDSLDEDTREKIRPYLFRKKGGK
ncbi:MAG: hypothetical protein OEV42_17930 [Deltaproteobacteria bacterium]|nr:hypothetical protein [Deltaproteobacteria bacterium]